MKIDNSIKSVTNISVNDGKRRPGIASSTKPGQEHTNGNVHISSHAIQLQTVDNNTSDSGAAVNTARIQEIKQAISEGNFKVNPEAIADRLLETVKELIQSKQGKI